LKVWWIMQGAGKT